MGLVITYFISNGADDEVRTELNLWMNSLISCLLDEVINVWIYEKRAAVSVPYCFDTTVTK